MIPEKTKCIIKSAPEGLAHLLGKEVTATGNTGARGTGTQEFKLDGAQIIFGNADSGIVIEPK